MPINNLSFTLDMLCVPKHATFFIQAQASLAEASCKLELLRLSLEKRLEELSPNGNSNKIDALRQELEGASPTTFARNRNSTLTKAQQQYSSLAKPAALTGKLQVR